MRVIFFLFVCAWGLSSCDSSNVVFERNTSLPGATWSAAHPVLFEFEASDTITLHNMYINLRHGEGYPYSNIYMFVDLEFPNGKHSIDTLECTLADPTGRWLGKGLGDVYESRYLFKHRKSFPMSGHYKVAVNYAMRPPEMKEIYDIGFRLEKAD